METEFIKDENRLGLRSFTEKKQYYLTVGFDDLERKITVSYHVTEYFDLPEDQFVKLRLTARRVKDIEGLLRLLAVMRDITKSSAVATAYQTLEGMYDRLVSVPVESFSGGDTVRLVYEERGTRKGSMSVFRQSLALMVSFSGFGNRVGFSYDTVNEMVFPSNKYSKFKVLASEANQASDVVKLLDEL